MNDSTKSPIQKTGGDLAVFASRLRTLCLRYVNPIDALRKEGRDALSGEIWSTKPYSKFPPNVPEQFQTEEPVWVLVFASEPVWVGDHRLFHVAPIFHEVEMADTNDVLLPIGVLGFQCAVAMGRTLTILEDSLAEPKVRISDTILNHLVQFRETIIRSEPHGEKAVCTGFPYVGPSDVRIGFHKKLGEKLDYLWEPVAMAVETMPLNFPEVSTAGVIRHRSLLEGWVAVLFGVADRGVPSPGRVLGKSRRVPHTQRASYAIGETELILRLRVQGDRRNIEAAVLTGDGELSHSFDGALLKLGSNRVFRVTNGQVLFPFEFLEGRIKLVGTDGRVFQLRKMRQ